MPTRPEPTLAEIRERIGRTLAAADDQKWHEIWGKGWKLDLADLEFLVELIEKQQKVIEAGEKAFVKMFDRIATLQTEDFGATEFPMREAWDGYRSALSALEGKSPRGA